MNNMSERRKVGSKMGHVSVAAAVPYSSPRHLSLEEPLGHRSTPTDVPHALSESSENIATRLAKSHKVWFWFGIAVVRQKRTNVSVERDIDNFEPTA